MIGIKKKNPPEKLQETRSGCWKNSQIIEQKQLEMEQLFHLGFRLNHKKKKTKPNKKAYEVPLSLQFNATIKDCYHCSFWYITTSLTNERRRRSFLLANTQLKLADILSLSGRDQPSQIPTMTLLHSHTRARAHTLPASLKCLISVGSAARWRVPDGGRKTASEGGENKVASC